MKSLNLIERAAFEAANKWRLAHGLAPLCDPAKRTCTNCRSRPASFDDEVCTICAQALYADEDEPDRYPDDKYLDDPRHDQCQGGKFKE